MTEHFHHGTVSPLRQAADGAPGRGNQTWKSRFFASLSAFILCFYRRFQQVIGPLEVCNLRCYRGGPAAELAETLILRACKGEQSEQPAGQQRP